jgi:hypothetical protein
MVIFGFHRVLAGLADLNMSTAEKIKYPIGVRREENPELSHSFGSQGPQGFTKIEIGNLFSPV